MSKARIRLENGRCFAHDFAHNDPYAELFQIIREILGIDVRVKWFKEIKDEFYERQCFG